MVFVQDFHNNHPSRQMIACDYPYYAHTDASKMLCNSNLDSHIMQICLHLDAPFLASEAGLLLRTDGLSLTLSAAVVSPANAISCSSAWGEQHPSVANSIWWRHIKVSSLSSLLSCSVSSSAAKHQMLTSQDKMCMCVCVRACSSVFVRGNGHPIWDLYASCLICLMCFQSSAVSYCIYLIIIMPRVMVNSNP